MYKKGLKVFNVLHPILHSDSSSDTTKPNMTSPGTKRVFQFDNMTMLIIINHFNCMCL